MAHLLTTDEGDQLNVLLFVPLVTMSVVLKISIQLMLLSGSVKGS